MSNYIEYNDKIAFHPGYYIKEIVEESGLTQKDFANRLDTTPKNLSLLLKGSQNLSIDIAGKLSRMMGTSVEYWLNLQKTYDSLIAEFKSDEELIEERGVFASLNYNYFRKEYGLPDFSRKIDEQIRCVREFLGVATLKVLTKRDLTVNFRSSTAELSEASIVRANAMLQIATNKALKKKAPKFNKPKFEKAISYALTLTENHTDFYQLIYKKFFEAGVIFIVLPNLQGSKINGATKKIGNSIMLMVNDRRLNADTFWFTLFHEIGHIFNGDYGMSFEKENGEVERLADSFAANCLVPSEAYEQFVCAGSFTYDDICKFAKQIERDPGIVLGRLQNDRHVDYNNAGLNALRRKYKAKISI